jgi:hypothetical protein
MWMEEQCDPLEGSCNAQALQFEPGRTHENPLTYANGFGAMGYRKKAGKGTKGDLNQPVVGSSQCQHHVGTLTED